MHTPGGQRIAIESLTATPAKFQSRKREICCAGEAERCWVTLVQSWIAGQKLVKSGQRSEAGYKRCQIYPAIQEIKIKNK